MEIQIILLNLLDFYIWENKIWIW